ncbi:hypothetical protein SBA3_250001 [Candidatus Sulfopaludibacter sp. SbA3]|nr:hypothetical protein SBA3_250001 [Candidatus Sulfopaludibacter sp. SbA3]
MRRAAVSVPANIEEGFRRRGRVDKARFMNLAEGSLEESRYYLILAQDLGYGDTAKLAAAFEEVSRMLNAYAAATGRRCRAKDRGLIDGLTRTKFSLGPYGLWPALSKRWATRPDAPFSPILFRRGDTYPLPL